MKLFQSSSKEETSGSTKKCSDCLAEIPKEAKKCSQCGTKQKMAVTKMQILGVFASIILFSVFIAFTGGGDSSSSIDTSQPGDSVAYIIAQGFVKSGLKSPSTADFPFADYRYRELGINQYIVSSYVDAQNSFGATIRSDWTVTLKHNGGDWADANNWTLNKLILDDEVLYNEN